MCQHLLQAYDSSRATGASGHVAGKMERAKKEQKTAKWFWDLTLSLHFVCRSLYTKQPLTSFQSSQHTKALSAVDLHFFFFFTARVLLVCGSRVQLFSVSAVCQLNQKEGRSEAGESVIIFKFFHLAEVTEFKHISYKLTETVNYLSCITIKSGD